MGVESPGPRPVSLEERLEARLEGFWEAWRLPVYVSGLLVLLLLVYFAPFIFVTVGAGQQGVMFRRFGGGTVTDQTYAEGLHIIPPWDTLTVYDVRAQQTVLDFTLLSKEALEVSVKVSIRYHPRVDRLGLLHQHIGPDYCETLVKPEIQARMRAVGSGLAAEDIASRRELIEQAILTNLQSLNENYVVLDDLLIREVRLPRSVQEAIESRLRAEQLAKEYDFRIAREEKEASRKRIEAAGIRDFQDIISKGISEELLRWRGIEATLELARSENAKVVVIGSGKDGLPLILDTAARPASPAKAAAPEVRAPPR